MYDFDMTMIVRNRILVLYNAIRLENIPWGSFAYELQLIQETV